MPEWMDAAPWWAIATLAIGGVALIVRIAFWLGQIGTRLAAVEHRLDAMTADFKAMFTELRNDIKSILTRMAVPPTIQSNSPVRLSEFGEKISATAEAKAWAVNQAENLVDDASGKPEFEIFDLCVSYVAEQMKKHDFNRKARAAAYEHGIDLEQVRKVYEVELRDRVLALLQPKDKVS